MRLWQKIFLLTLCLTALAVDSVSLVLLTRNQAGSLSLARDRIGTVCDGAVQELGHLIQERKEELGCLMLTESEMETLISKIRLDADGQLFLTDADEGVVKTEDVNGSRQVWENAIRVELVCGESAGNMDGPGVFLFSSEQLSPEAGSVRTELAEERGSIRICRSTTAFWEGRFYRVKVSSDLAELFGRFREDLVFSQWMSGGVSLLTAVVLLCSILYLTRPLKRLEAATEQIAGGEYGYRIQVKGNDEIAELARHMNGMAAEVEASIRRVEELARGRETFIANMAHELKTPLTSILGFADIMTIQSDMGEAERREYAAVIAAEAKRLKIL